MKSDLHEFVGESDLDVIAATATGPRTAYGVARQLQNGGAEYLDWLTWAGNNAVDPEDGFIHTAAARNTFLRGGSLWNTMNIANANYQTWLVAHIIDILKGTFWGPGAPTTAPYEGVLIDVTLWYPAEPDVEGVWGSDEYPTEPGDDSHPYMAACVTLFTAVQAAVAAEWPTSTPFVYPNFGSTQFLDRDDANTNALIAASNYILAQIAWDNNATDTAIGKSAVTGRLTEIELVTDQSKYLMCTFLDDNTPTDKATLLAVALFNLAYSDYLYARCATALESEASNVKTWEKHDALRVAHMLGPPTAARTVDGTGRLFSRTFQNGVVYAWIKNVKTDASDSTVVTGHSGDKKLGADGSLADITGDITLDANEGLVVLQNVQKATFQLTATDAEFLANKSPNQTVHLNLPGPLPGDSNLYIANQVANYLQVDAVNDSLPENIRCGRVDVEMRASGLVISTDPSADISIDTGDVVVDKRGATLTTSGIEEVAYKCHGQKMERADVADIGVRLDYREGEAGDDPGDDVQEV